MKVSELRKMVDEISEDYDDNDVLIAGDAEWNYFYKFEDICTNFYYKEDTRGTICDVEHISDIKRSKRKKMERAIVLS